MQIEVGKKYVTRDGRVVGPMVKSDGRRWPSGFYIAHLHGDENAWWSDGGYGALQERPEDLISEWTNEPKSPVRTVTRMEIVSGVYGAITVGDTNDGKVFAAMATVYHDANSLRSAAMILSQIAEALDSK